MKKLASYFVLYLVFASSGSYGESLGNLSSNPYDPKSTSNPYGAGSPYDPNSVNNPYGEQGSPH